MKKVFLEFIFLVAYIGLGWALNSFINEDYHYYSVDEDELNLTQQPGSLSRFLCPPPFPDLLEIFKPSLQKSQNLKNATRHLVENLLAEDCETFAPLFNGFLSEFNSNLCPFYSEHSPILQTDEIIENAETSTCLNADLSDEEWGKRGGDIDGDWKIKRAGRKDDSEIDSYHYRLNSIEKEGKVGDFIEYKAIGGIHHKAGMRHDGDGVHSSKGVFSNKGTLDEPTQDHIVSNFQRVGSIILVVVFVSVLISVVVVVAVLAWVRNHPNRPFVDVQSNIEDKSGGNHWYDATASKESYLMEERRRTQAVKQYL